VDKCEICKKNSKSKPKPAIAIPKAAEFNSIVAMDLKGKVLNDKKLETILKALHRGWCLPYGY